jgi:protein TonB
VARPSGLLIISLAVHAGLAVGIGSIEIKKSRAATAISYAESHKKKPPEPAKVDPTPPEKAAHALAHRPAPAPEPPDAPPPPKSESAAFDAVPDFGVSLTGGVNGTGIALPMGGGGPMRERAVEKVMRKALPVSAVLPIGDCDDPPAKPKPISIPQPGYTPDAQAAAIEGKVRVQLTVDENGKVVEVKLIQGLGHGLDEAALQAARSATFEPALRCGKPMRATFTLGMRFKLPT